MACLPFMFTFLSFPTLGTVDDFPLSCRYCPRDGLIPVASRVAIWGRHIVLIRRHPWLAVLFGSMFSFLVWKDSYCPLQTVQDTGFFLWVKCDTRRASFFRFGSPLWPVPWKQKLKWNMWEKFSPIPIALGSLVEENTEGPTPVFGLVRVRCFVHYVRLKESSVSVHVCVCICRGFPRQFAVIGSPR